MGDDRDAEGSKHLEASLEMVFAYETLPGNPSSHCYPYPTSVNLPTMRMTYFSDSAPPANENPSAERWVKVNEEGVIDTIILATELGWMHADEVLKQRWAPLAEIPESRPPQDCWYYRPLLISRSWREPQAVHRLKGRKFWRASATPGTCEISR